MKKIRILHLITDLGKGGAERFLLDLCKELENYANIDFRVGVLYDNNRNQIFTSNLPIVQLNYTSHSFRRVNDCIEYKKLLNEFKPHIIHSHRFLAEFLSSYYVNPNICYVCHGHDNMIQLNRPSLNTFMNKRLLLNYLERLHLIFNKYNRVPTYFIANSRHTENYYRKVLPRHMISNVKLIEYGFDSKKFYDSKQKSLPKTNERLKIINVGSFQKKKNQKFIVEIGKALRDRAIDFEIHLLGDGELRQDVEKQVHKNDLTQYIYFHGVVDNVEDWLKKSHLYLHTAWYEPFGLVFLEAMAAGLPCIAYNGQGNRDLIKNGKNGYFLEEHSASLFAEKIIELISNEQLYLEISNYCKSFALNYDIEIKTKELIDFYNQIVSELKE
ncbi:glycosyltransferase [Fulvivirga lutea]|uniref:Glycosyltransferase n=1 Tax=Fulvivirga lutea TaxID=2810512 RepID=A0A974WH44_9BACT|nr:glycosyltransferase [Fulvivirga lutea]QSE98444.1 glycosyltransferase [Fulvivirga lutea]